MCLSIFSNVEYRDELAAKRAARKMVKFAKKDQLVYKVLIREGRNKFHGRYQNFFYWERGYEYYQDVPLKPEILYSWDAYDAKIFEGLHFCFSKGACKTHASMYEKTVIAEFILPKGTKYYIDHMGDDGVAEALIFPHNSAIRKLSNY